MHIVKQDIQSEETKLTLFPQDFQLRFPIFSFPTKKTDLNKKWIKFVNRNNWVPPNHGGICAKHFESKFLKVGKRTTLRWDLEPVPSIYTNTEAIPPSVLPTSATSRKPPTRVTTLPDQTEEFNDLDKIVDFASINESICPSDYKLQVNETKAVFYKLEQCEVLDIPKITEVIAIDNDLHVKLFLSGSPVPLPVWFTKGKDCRLTKKSYLENFPPYIRSFSEDSHNNIMDELLEIRFKKPNDKPKFSSELLQFALMLRYTSLPAYRLLLDYFALPSISLLKKLSRGGVEPLKAIQVLLMEEKIDKDVVLLIDEMYLQKEVQFQQGKVIGCDNDGNLFKGIMTFMIVGLRKSIPLVVKAVPESKIEGKWLSAQIEESIQSLHEIGFHVRAVISDNHPSNVSAFRNLLSKYGCTSHEHAILHPSTQNRISYLFFDSVHLLKNIRNNLLNSRRFIFPAFEYPRFITLPAGEISWKLLHDIFDQDEQLQANLRKAKELTYTALHPGDNRQSVPLALAIFDANTSTALKSYFPEHENAAKFFELINLWWTMSNSKQELNMNFHIGDAAKLNDCKPVFLRKLADWFADWKVQQSSNTEKYTLSKQTTSALVTTLRCTASLIEDLLNDGYSYVLTARFLTDPLERRFSRYRQMSVGRFLVGLREVNTSERILTIKSLLKESISFWEEDVVS